MDKISNRPRRVAAVIKRELADILLREIKDPRVGHITVTAVDVSPDLKFAKIYFVSESQGKDQSVIDALNKTTGFIRHTLSSRMKLRVTPSLRFVYDESAEEGNRITALIDQNLSELAK